MEGGSRAFASAFLLLTSFFTVAITLPGEASAYASHGPIEIFNDDNFTAANGVTAGTGTWEDPYVISGWEIDLSSVTSSWDNPVLAGINIQNTESNFVIRNVYVHSGFRDAGSQAYSPIAGVVLYHVAGVRIDDSRFANNSYGVHVIYSWSVTISGCDIIDNPMGIYSDGLQGSIVTNNVISRSTNTGVELDSAAHCSITDNTITQCDLFGINCYGSEDATISGNDINNNMIGLNIGYSNSVRVTNNSIADNDNFGMMAYGCTDLTVGGNTVSHNKIEISGEGGATNWVAVAAVTISVLAAIAIILVIMFRPKKGSPEVSSVPMQSRPEPNRP